MDPYNCTQELHGGTPDNRFYLMDALEALEELLPQYAGKVQLIYLDPPFLTGDTFSYRQHIALKGHAKPYTLEQTAYSDTLPPEEYYAFMRKILAGCHELLSREGSIYLHVDARAGARLRLLLDEIFGENNFLNEIIWHYKSGGRAKTHYSRKHDNIYFYRKSRDVYFDIASVGVARGRESRNHMRKEVDENGRVVFTIPERGKSLYLFRGYPRLSQRCLGGHLPFAAERSGAHRVRYPKARGSAAPESCVPPPAPAIWFWTSSAAAAQPQ